MIRNLFLTAAFVAVTCLAVAPVSAQMESGNSPNHLFTQYTTPNGPNMTTAGMYPAPHYSPPLGAQSNYTYQPLMPHEMMYAHSRNYYNYYNNSGYGAPNSLNKTSVRWQSTNQHIAPLRCGGGLGRLKYRIQNHHYKINSGGRGGRGGVGCSDGNCGAEATCGNGTDGGSCGTSANLSDESLQR